MQRFYFASDIELVKEEIKNLETILGKLGVQNKLCYLRGYKESIPVPVLF